MILTVTAMNGLYSRNCFVLFLARVNSRSRSLLLANVSTLRSQYAIAILSVVCRLSSVTLVRPSQPVEIFGNFFHHTTAQGV